MKVLIPFITLLTLGCTLCAEPSLRELLTPEQFETFGLNKLTEAELGALSAWVAGAEASAAVEEVRDPEEAFGGEHIYLKEKTKASDDVNRIESRLIGETDGWSGHTVFHLENGQVWRQIDGKRFFAGKLENPTVIIKKSFIGTYFLRFEGYGTVCKVKREQ